MEVDEIKMAFSERDVIGVECFDFQDLACSIPILRDIDKLNIIPALMMYILDNGRSKQMIENAEMVIFNLMPQPRGWSDLIDSMSKGEISATLKWLVDVKDYFFVENCVNEFNLAMELFKDRLA